ncbi:MAG: hypothetical protein Q4D05_04645 [Acinetobacter sp.]|nr:hypothetical protein [Acinetobacter sp.]
MSKKSLHDLRKQPSFMKKLPPFLIAGAVIGVLAVAYKAVFGQRKIKNISHASEQPRELKTVQAEQPDAPQTQQNQP